VGAVNFSALLIRFWKTSDELRRFGLHDRQRADGHSGVSLFDGWVQRGQHPLNDGCRVRGGHK
jgi:hypothetical protein